MDKQKQKNQESIQTTLLLLLFIIIVKCNLYRVFHPSRIPVSLGERIRWGKKKKKKKKENPQTPPASWVAFADPFISYILVGWNRRSFFFPFSCFFWLFLLLSYVYRRSIPRSKSLDVRSLVLKNPGGLIMLSRPA